MGMFTENYTGNRCSDCTWADKAEEKINSLQQLKAEIRSVVEELVDNQFEGEFQLLNKCINKLRELSAV